MVDPRPDTDMDGPFSSDRASLDAFDDEPEWLIACIDEMVDRWNRGDRPPLGSVLGRFPAIDDRSAIRLIYEDISIRRDAGIEIRTDEVLGQFPRYRQQLAILLGCDRLLQPATPIRLPDPGERLGDFSLHSVLGEGATGRTYLADQPNLADRLVVLKVMPLEHDEHLSLARLQHSFIVPLFSEHNFSELGLRALCMPFLGGSDLARILTLLQPIPIEKRSWGDVIDALDRVRPRHDAHQGVVAPLRKNRDRITYEKGVCLITSFLAEALHYAHERGLIHLDVKPSNVLIAADGEPMLLDFHLAQPPIRAGAPVPRLGGTRGYMSPEQQRALDCIRSDDPIDVEVDRRSDVYSLGLVLSEILAGRPLNAEELANPRVDRLNRQMSAGLAAIIARCLAFDPRERYQTAEALADDLKRVFRNEPPVVGRPRGLVEAIHQFRNRRARLLPKLLAPLLVTITLFLLGLGFLFTYWVRSEQADRSSMVANHTIQMAERLRHAGMLEDAKRNLSLVSSLADRVDPIGRPVWLDRYELEQTLLDDAIAARQLQRLAQFARQTTAVHDSASESVREFLKMASKVAVELPNWSEGALARADEAMCRSIIDNLYDVVITYLYLRRGPRGSGATTMETVSTLNALRLATGTRTSLQIEARRILPKAAWPDWVGTEPSPPTTAADYAQVGRAYLRDQKYADASRAFHESVRLAPDDAWTSFYEGFAALQCHDHETALASLGEAIVLAPKVATFYFHRALAAEKLGYFEVALFDYHRVLALEPGFHPARFNRGNIQYRRHRYPEAIADFQASKDWPDPRMRGALYYNLALAQFALADQPSGAARREDFEASLTSAREAHRLGHDKAQGLLTLILSKQSKSGPMRR